MSNNRKLCLEQLKKVSECEVILVTIDNLHEYILPEYPLHPAYKFLSETHKADYLRTYFMNFYGGGYSDIKNTSGSWKKGFSELNNSPNYWMCGYPEIPGGAAFGNWQELIGNCAYISKPNTPLTNEWYRDMIALLDTKLEKLEKYPATFPQDHAEISNGKYPIEWNEMLGRIFHKIVAKYNNHTLRNLPISIFSNYR